MSFECFDTWPCFFDPSWCVTSCSNVFGHLRDHSWWSPRGSLQHADISPSKVPELPSWIESHGRTKLPACVWWSRRTAYLRAKRFLNVVRSYSCSGILYTEEYYTTTRQRQGSVLCRALLNKDWCSGWSYMQCCCVLTSGRRRLCISSVPRGRSDTTKVKEYHSQIVYRALYFASLLCVLVFNVNNWQSGTRGREI